MALVKCPECGRENVSDTAVSCPNCGYGIKEHFEQEKIKSEQEKRKHEYQAKKAMIEKKTKIEADKLQAELNRELSKIDRLTPPHRATLFEFAFDSNVSGGGADLTHIAIIGLVASLLLAIIFPDAAFLFYAIFGLILFIGVPFLIFLIKTDYDSYDELYKKETEDWEAEKNRRKQVIISQYDRYARNMAVYGKREMPIDIPKQQNENKLKCPICGATDIERITTINRVASVAMVGIASGKIGKQYKCKKCKHLW